MLLRKGEFSQFEPHRGAIFGRCWSASRARGAWALIVLSALALIAIGFWFLAGGKQPAAAMPPAAVTVALPLQRSIIEYDEFTGRFEPSRTVEIRPRVTGQLRAVHFRDGDFVRQGNCCSPSTAAVPGRRWPKRGRMPRRRGLRPGWRRCN